MHVVTGGAGFIGSNLVRALVADGIPVRVVDNFETGKRANLEGLTKKLDLVEGDIGDIEICRAAMRGAEVVYHQAALPSVPRSIQDPVATNKANAVGTLNLLVAARDAGVRRFVYASSSSAYGDSPTLPKVETMPTTPLSPYAVAKLAGEQYCRVFHRVYGFETVSLRYFNIYGPRQDPASQYSAVIPKFITACLAETPPTVHGDGTQSRDFTFIDDCVSANRLAASAAEAAGEVFNIATGSRIDLNTLYEKIRSIIGGGPDPVYGNPRPGDVKHSLADIEKAEKLLGYVPRSGIEAGLEKTVEWFKRIG